MRIEWVNHACLVHEYGNVRLITDPWLEGPAFHDGWRHLAPTQLPWDAFRDITRIWFSHEHPDHFSPPNVARIPPEARARITVYYQTTRDRKVVQYCQKMGFARVVELPPGEWVEVAPGFDILNEPQFNGDSWLCIRTPEHAVLNLNDCVIRTAADCGAIRDRLAPHLGGRGIDGLLTQFSYASWVGNRGDLASHRRHAEEKLARIRTQVEVLRPAWVIPFASYVWFAHEENHYLNEAANRIGDVHRFVEGLGTQSVVLYPGERWDVGAPHDSAASVARYDEDSARVFDAPELMCGATVAFDELVAGAETFRKRLLTKNGWLYRLARRLRPLPPARIHVTDLDVRAAFSLERGLERLEADAGTCDIALASEALAYCFAHEWGGGTLAVNGRFQAPPGGDAGRFHVYMELAGFNNRGWTYPALVGVRLRNPRAARRLEP